MSLYSQCLDLLKDSKGGSTSSDGLTINITVIPGRGFMFSCTTKPVCLNYDVYWNMYSQAIGGKCVFIQDSKSVLVDPIIPENISDIIGNKNTELWFDDRIIKYSYKDNKWCISHSIEIRFNSLSSDYPIIRSEIYKLNKPECNFKVDQSLVTDVDSKMLDIKLLDCLKSGIENRIYRINQEQILKIYPSTIGGLRQFLVEMDITNRIKSKHLNKTRYAFSPESKLLHIKAIITDYNPKTLEYRLSSGLKAYPMKERLENIYQLLSLLYQLHSNNIIHGDIKCDQILFDSDNTIKLIDYDSSEYLDSKDPNSIKFQADYYYSWRELDNKVHGAASDIFALGHVAVDIIRGITNSTNNIEWAKIPKDYQERIKFVSSLVSESPIIVDFISNILEPDWTKRKSAQELLGHEIFKDFKSPHDSTTVTIYDKEIADKSLAQKVRDLLKGYKTINKCCVYTLLNRLVKVGYKGVNGEFDIETINAAIFIIGLLYRDSTVEINFLILNKVEELAMIRTINKIAFKLKGLLH